jgi:hypothetical protein
VTKESQAQNGAEADLVDRIAGALPAELRADYYREMRHCRSLPESDEMLRILRAMQFLTTLMYQVPGRIAEERARLDGGLNNLAVLLKAAQEASAAYHGELDGRLSELPRAIADGISPEAIAAKINESLRQQFVKSTIPQSAEVLSGVAAHIKAVAVDFGKAAGALGAEYHGAAADASSAVERIESAITRATETARRAASELSWTFHEARRWSIYTLCSAALGAGLLIGAVGEWWLDWPPQPQPGNSAASVQQNQTPTPNAEHGGAHAHNPRNVGR